MKTHEVTGVAKSEVSEGRYALTINTTGGPLAISGAIEHIEHLITSLSKLEERHSIMYGGLGTVNLVDRIEVEAVVPECGPTVLLTIGSGYTLRRWGITDLKLAGELADKINRALEAHKREGGNA